MQFEDDEYYYYVKAVPKMTVAAPTNTVKKINTQRRPANQTAHPAGRADLPVRAGVADRMSEVRKDPQEV